MPLVCAQHKTRTQVAHVMDGVVKGRVVGCEGDEWTIASGVCEGEGLGAARCELELNLKSWIYVRVGLHERGRWEVRDEERSRNEGCVRWGGKGSGSIV